MFCHRIAFILIAASGEGFHSSLVPGDRSSDGGTIAMEANFKLLSSETPDTPHSTYVEFSMGQYVVTVFLYFSFVDLSGRVKYLFSRSLWKEFCILNACRSQWPDGLQRKYNYVITGLNHTYVICFSP